MKIGYRYVPRYQGTRLGLFLFLILINAAGYEHLMESVGQHITKKKNKRTKISNIHLKFVDDMTLGEALNLRECLVPNPEPNQPYPLAYHDRTQHVLPDSSNKMQMQLNRLVDYCTENDMRINQGKTKVTIFNTARLYDFMPRLCIGENTNLEVVEQFKLLGVIFQSNLRWQANTDFVCKKAYARLWMIRRLKGLGASCTEMLDVFYKQIRCVLEMAVAVWEPCLTQAQSKQLERVQQCAFYIIMGNSYTNYDAAVKFLESDKLSIRRSNLCLSFALKCEKNEKYQTWFTVSDTNEIPLPNTRSDKSIRQTKYKPVPTRTDRYNNSPIPYLTNILNEHHSKKK